MYLTTEVEHKPVADCITEGYDLVVAYLPPQWKMLEERADGALWINKALGVTVVLSCAIESDNRRWIHASIARRSRMPSYDDLALLKRLFIGEDRKAVMVLPERKNHINIHPNCLHLFTCIDEDPLPEFSRYMGTL